MNYGELKKSILALGFGDNSDYEEYEELGYTYSAINMAIAEIGTRFPYVKRHDIELPTNAKVCVNMRETVNDFLGFAPRTVRRGTGASPQGYTEYYNYELDLDGESVWIKTDRNPTPYSIFYRCNCDAITSETPNDFNLQLPLKAHYLVPLLASYFLWLDDEPTKSAQYYNMYETEYMAILQNENTPKMKIETNKTNWRTI